MYQVIENKVVLSVKDWEKAGLNYYQFNRDAKEGYLTIVRRSLHGNTVFDVQSVSRPGRLQALEAVFGPAPTPSAPAPDPAQEKEKLDLYKVEIDTAAQTFFLSQFDSNGRPLSASRVTEYTNKASIFLAIRRGLERQTAAYAKNNKRMNMGTYWKKRAEWFLTQVERFPCEPYGNPRSLERAFKRYLNEGYRMFIHGNRENDSARLVSIRTEKLLLALWTMNNKPFINEVHRLYTEFIHGKKELFDPETGELFCPQEFRYISKGGGEPRPLEISAGTVRNYLKKHLNEASRVDKRDGRYIAMVEKFPFVFRNPPLYSLSKVSMDDADMSRKLKNGTKVHRYAAIDVASGYWFTPVYSRDPLNGEDVIQCFRNMFCEIEVLGLPTIGEIEHEHHLVDKIMIEEFQKAFPFVTVSSHSRNKRAEHAIKALKWGVAHRNGNTNGRFYGKNAFRTPKNRVKGDWKEKEYEYMQIVQDDLADIEEHNKSLHQRQKTYPGMTREEVFLQKYNRNLPNLKPYYLYRYIGNETKTTVRNNNHLQVNYEIFLLDDFHTLERMSPGDCTVTAYWVPNFNDKVEKVYLYQNDKYVGSATNVERFRFNESKFEETDEDREKKTEQFKRLAKFEKMRKDINRDVPHVRISKVAAKMIDEVETEVVENVPAAEQAVGVEYDAIDYSRLGEEMA
ncbi:MAG: hypothetical protein LBC40_00915 [Dysgonamonadaceae bacterium]|jgi:hypothetical protein|nr:hypothetical protein [Dysgonamonadaceae bacterium]